jgi:hypothetical protein
MIVKFNDPKEFLEELAKDAQLIKRSIVRVTQQTTQSNQVPVIAHLSVVATAEVAGDIVRLDRYCGQLWNMGKDEKVLGLAKELVDRLIKGCEALSLEVRAGVIEPSR